MRNVAAVVMVMIERKQDVTVDAARLLEMPRVDVSQLPVQFRAG